MKSDKEGPTSPMAERKEKAPTIPESPSQRAIFAQHGKKLRDGKRPSE